MVSIMLLPNNPPPDKSFFFLFFLMVSLDKGVKKKAPSWKSYIDRFKLLIIFIWEWSDDFNQLKREFVRYTCLSAHLQLDSVKQFVNIDVFLFLSRRIKR
jgi:hypothetical protein